MVVMPSRCCSHCRLFCSSVSLRNISILVRLFQCKDGAVICVAGEHRVAGASPWPLGHMGPTVSWLSGGEGTLLHSTYSYSLTKSKNFWFCGRCSLILLQWAPPHSAAWNVLGEVLADLFRHAFSQQRHVLILWRYSVWLFPRSHGYCFFDCH